ncbi:MAG: DUF5716 family protein [Eubacteriales bacterium]|nr:DUF5716 family protein [Eubacteriales bacterium]
MNEIRDLMIGIDFGKDYSQICYYDRKAEEPRSVTMKVGSAQYEAPTCLCRREGQDDYCVGLEAEYFAQQMGGVLVDGLYGISASKEPVQVAGEQKEPCELLAYFFKGLLKFLGITDIVKYTKCLVITVPELGGVQVENLQKACALMGFPKEKCMLQDYAESFYYYVLTQKRETWNRNVAWYAFTPDGVTFRKLTMNSGTRPVLVRLEPAVSSELSAEPMVRDEDFCRFIQKTLGTDLYSSIQMTGEGFDQEWAKHSVKLLCYQKRKVFFGNNLFAKGACAAGVERLENKKLKGYRYFSDSLVMSDVGMDMRVMGSPTYYPLIEAGNNWYECRAYCEFILDNTRELVFIISTFGEQEKKRMVMKLPGLPERPNKTTRLSLSLQYLSPKECSITVKDLGFGEMFPSSGKVWTESAQW